ncbi:hypothetical protein BT9727_0808 [[Bacillus thuringiensis] serovar konkukian str. 97-27]|uniref:Uncharacterized protein n=1 Tax=Bacillus thuringiensis subsp. konkukian (strain 97-27) TaxID=281309 RepID=Q6HMS0_BACHK|nr:hypothetical protein BT9727_0808 [[Bacillus thuringiensis] serovar konkukian str. 97-27]PFU36518.1 hypothetical protein COK69_00175 [Bacillus cereus]BCC22248.1 hypothetical protein BCM0079_0841 [Bacillus cereus]
MKKRKQKEFKYIQSYKKWQLSFTRLPILFLVGFANTCLLILRSKRKVAPKYTIKIDFGATFTFGDSILNKTFNKFYNNLILIIKNPTFSYFNSF